MPDDNPNEDLEAEGIPPIEERIPGRDVETSDEGMMAPREHSIAAGSDPAYSVTAAEERFPESVEARARRENPEVGQGDFGRDEEAGPAPRLMDPDSDIDEIDVTAEAVGDVAEDSEGGLTAEESAMHIVSEDMADDVDPGVEAREYTGDR